jgi:hypothetical protein
MKIAEVSEKFGLTTDTLRYDERIGCFLVSTGMKSGFVISIRQIWNGWILSNACAAQACRSKN